MRNLDNFRQAVESPKSWNSMGYICLKTTFLHLKHLQIYLTLLSTDLWFGKWHEEYDKFFPEHSELGFCWDPSIQTWKTELKIHREVICHDNEELCKIWRETDVSFQSWHEEFDEFWPGHFKVSKILSLMKLKRDTKFGKESTCHFKIGMRNFINFELSTRKSQ